MTTLDDYSLSHRYTGDEGRVFLTGVQALTRVPIGQLRVDRANGLNTAAFLSGYQGSPLGGFDQEVARAQRLVPDLPMVCRPAVNEELGATAVMGSQLVTTQDDATYDGVIGMWYGKAPGLDRASDALRHAVFAGSGRNGGAVALVGDDPACKSSTLPSSSDTTLIDLKMPTLYPGDVQEVLDLGRHAVVLSRLSGMWTAMKIVTAVADGSGSADIDLHRVTPEVPDLTVDGVYFTPQPSGRLIAPYTNEMEREIREVRLVIARRYGVENRLNRVTADPGADAWLGIAATGYTYRETLEALRRLGLGSEQAVADAGIRLLHLQMPFPVDPGVIRDFARGLDEVVVVEEKNPTLEWLIKDALYSGPDRPLVTGKVDDTGDPLIPGHGFLSADQIVPALRRRLSGRLADRLTPEPQPVREKVLIPVSSERAPYFCSGCPHNWGTKVPDGALTGAGIGCSGMALLMDESKVGDIAGITCMGTEGSQWLGMAPFLGRDHFIQNLGDGTYFHSGQLAVQAAVAAGAHMTYKLLYNGTVAMTGGQDPAGGLGVPEIAEVMLAQGVTEVLVTTDDVSAYDGVELPSGDRGRTKLWDRSRIVEAQDYLAAVPGVTVLIHDQACAAQARRLRKRGRAETPKFKIAINHRICEACGDCGDVSNCLSVQSIDTPLGPKTTIDQTSCNLDYSCLGGDCPSFMQIEPRRRGGQPSTAGRRTIDPERDLPAPEVDTERDRVQIRLAGIGGTGVVTVAQIVGTAAMLDGWDVRGLDQTGLSQKAGPVISDLRLSRKASLESNLVGEGEADVIVAFDLLVGSAEQALKAASPDRTVLISSSTETPTGEMVGNADLAYPDLGRLRERAATGTRAESNRYVDAGAITKGLLGDAATANVFLIGVAVQAGAIPVDPATMARAIDLNGVAVEANLASFNWGRRWVVEAREVEAAAGLGGTGPGPTVETARPRRRAMARIEKMASETELADLLTMLTADLTAYQNARYAGRFLDVVEQVASAEAGVAGRPGRFTEAVARGLHKLMAYKDEYEVARLLIGPEAKATAEAVGGQGAKVVWRLDPPVLKALGRSGKIGIGAGWGRPIMAALAGGKRLRGTALDPFGRAEVRKVERALIEEYRRAILALADRLDDDNIARAVEVASAAMQVRGYEDIKLARAATLRSVLEAVEGPDES